MYKTLKIPQKLVELIYSEKLKDTKSICKYLCTNND